MCEDFGEILWFSQVSAWYLISFACNKLLIVVPEITEVGFEFFSFMQKAIKKIQFENDYWHQYSISSTQMGLSLGLDPVTFHLHNRCSTSKPPHVIAALEFRT